MQPVKQADVYFNQDNVPVSNQFDDIYFSTQDGLQESAYVFQQGNQLWQRWLATTQSHFVIAETGFGTGLNFLAVVQLFDEFCQKHANLPLKRLFFLSFEKYPLNLAALQQAHLAYPQFAPLAKRLQQYWLEPIQGCYRFHFDHTTLDLWFGDINDNLPQLGDYMNEKVDAWFLDGFSPSKNPAMWTEILYQNMFRLTKSQGSFATFTAASQVRKGLENAGFVVKKQKGYGKKREMLYGYKNQANHTALCQTPWYLAQSAHLAHQDIALIGGGIASLFTALSLLKRGAKVTLYCEDEQPALNASGNKQGAFYPQLSDDDMRNVRFYIQAFAYGRQQLLTAIEQGIEFEHEFCGVALCGYSAKAQAKLDKITAQQWSSTLYQAVQAEELSQIIGLPVDCAGGFIPQGAWLAPRQFVQNMFAYLQQLGLEIKTSQKITALLPNNSQWTLQNAQRECFEHSVVVLANGHKINQFAQTAQLPTYPVRGQVSQIATSSQLLKLKTVVCYDGYLTPVDQAKQSHCIGASHVRDNDDRSFSLEEQQQNQAKIQQNLANSPWVQEVNTETNLARIGVRCAIRDRIPLMGNVPNFAQQVEDYRNLFNLRRRKQPIKSAVNFDNLFIIGALGSRGLTSAPLLGESLASLIYNEPIPLSEDILHALSPNRSWIRKLLKGTVVG